jgi:hypothetical protein
MRHLAAGLQAPAVLKLDPIRNHDLNQLPYCHLRIATDQIVGWRSTIDPMRSVGRRESIASPNEIVGTPDEMVPDTDRSTGPHP